MALFGSIALAGSREVSESIKEPPIRWKRGASISNDILEIASTLSSTWNSVQNPTINLSIPSTGPSEAIQVPADFVGFGFETAFLPNYAVGTFSENLINSVAGRLSAPITIRIGGTTGDRVQCDPEQHEDAICLKGDCPVGSTATFALGSGYFDAFAHFQNQRMTFQAPMGVSFSVDESLDYVKRAYAALGPERVAGIALGNEPDLYTSQYNVDYTISDYVRDAKALQPAIMSALDLPDSRIFEALDFAAPGKFEGFTAQSAWEGGIDATSNIKFAAGHWYQFPAADIDVYAPETMQRYLMNHSAITARFEEGYAADLAYLAAHAPKVDYVLSETGSSLVGPPLSFLDSLGAALWAVDFSLYAMSRGVKRVDASQRPAAVHSLWVPDDSTNNPDLGNEYNAGPQVRGTWFAAPFLADVVGTNPGRVVRLWEDEFGAAYGMFDSNDGKLAKVAVVNLRFWNQGVGGLDGTAERRSVDFSIPVESGVSEVTVQRLSAVSGAHALGYDAGGAEQIITWAGETWSYSQDTGMGHFVDGVDRSESVEVSNGVAIVSVEDTSAAIISIDGGWP